MRLMLWLVLGGAVAQAAPVKLQFWHSMSGAKQKLVDEIVAGFNKTDSGFQVDAQFVGSYPEGLNKLRTSLLAKRGPHIVQIYDIGTKVMIDSEAVTPLADFIEKDNSFPLKQILPQIRRYYEVGGRMYSLPFATSTPIVYYNQKLLKAAGIGQVPATYEELALTARKLTDSKKGITGITWPLHAWFFEQLVARQGALLVNQENGREGNPTEALYDSPAGVRVAAFWHSLVKDGVFANVGRGWEPAEQNFLAGRSALLITSTSDVFEIAEKAAFPVGTAPLPAPRAHRDGGTVVGGNSLWILSDKPAAEQQGAYAFVKYMASVAAQEAWHKGTGYFPIRKDVISKLEKEGFYKKFPAARTALKQLEEAPSTRATQGALMGVFPEAREHVETALEEILSGRSGVEEALKKAKAKTDRALLRYNRTRKRRSS